MRTALVTLIATAAVVSAAQAQTPAAPAAQPAPTTAAPATSAPPAAAAPAATAATPPAATTDTTTPPAAAEAAPTLPTSGDGAVILTVIEKLCVPLVRGGKLDDLAKANGFKQNRRDGT